MKRDFILLFASVMYASNSFAGGAASTMRTGSSSNNESFSNIGRTRTIGSSSNFCRSDSSNFVREAVKQLDGPQFHEVMNKLILLKYKGSFRDALNDDRKTVLLKRLEQATTDQDRLAIRILQDIDEDATQWSKSNNSYQEEARKFDAIFKSEMMNDKLKSIKNSPVTHAQLNEKYLNDWVLNQINLAKTQQNSLLTPLLQDRLNIMNSRISKEVRFLNMLKNMSLKKIQDDEVLRTALRMISTDRSNHISNDEELQTVLDTTQLEKENLAKSNIRTLEKLRKKTVKAKLRIAVYQETIKQIEKTAGIYKYPLDKKKLLILGEFNPFPPSVEDPKVPESKTRSSRRNSQNAVRIAIGDNK